MEMHLKGLLEQKNNFNTYITTYSGTQGNCLKNEFGCTNILNCHRSVIEKLN